MSDVFHLGLSKSDVAGCRLAIIPGDPGRVPTVAEHTSNPRPLASNREFHSWRGDLDGNPLVICSTGIGGPSTSIAVEELAQLGVDTFLRVGTTGAIQPEVEVGDLIISHASVRLDGASLHFAPLEYPAAANFECTTALVAAADTCGFPRHVGVTVSSDTFYPGQERYDTASGFVRNTLRGSLAEWRSLGVLNYEMEGSTLFTMCSVNRWRAGMVAGVLVNRCRDELPSGADHHLAESRAIEAAIAAAGLLLTQPLATT